MQNREIEAFVHSTPVLRYWVNEQANLSVKVEASDVSPQRYAFALPTGSPHREPFNRALLKIINSAGWYAIQARYVPE